MKLQQVKEELGDCTRCKLSETRTNLVFGEGSPVANWVIIGEAPGKTEDEQGLPFVGKAGQLLNQLIEEAGLSREDVYITNTVCCRPPDNRDPAPEEAQACRPFLIKRLGAIQPSAVTTLGLPAVRSLLGTKEPLYKLRGSVREFEGIPVIPTYHPSYIQRGNWNKLDTMREDLGKALELALSGGTIPAGPMEGWAVNAVLRGFKDL